MHAPHTLTRRDVLLSSLGLAGAALLAPDAALAQPSAANATSSPARSAGGPPPTRVLRFAHLTDSHIQPERGAFDGVLTCLRHAMALPDRPELVVTGGDLIMDSFEATRQRTALQWELFLTAFRDECPLPILHTLGNHDIWGWNQRASKTTGDEPEWGKKWALEALALPAPYYALDRGPWRFLILDSVAPHRGDAYIAKLDEPQLAWLDTQLADAAAQARHVVVVSHIPILSLTVFDLDARVDADDQRWLLPGGVMHIDAKDILALFRKHRSVRLCLSGHIHMIDRCTFDDVTYICDGAVSGAWWRGPRNRCPEGYGVIDLFDDGSFDHRYVAYPWTPRDP